MRTPTHRRRVRTWAALTTTVVIAIVFLVSTQVGLAWAPGQIGSSHPLVGVSAGVFGCGIDRSLYTDLRTRADWHGETRIELLRFDADWSSSEIYVVFPLWLPLMLTSALCVFYWRADRPHTGRCAGCGYDLAAIESDRCPECGNERRDEQAAPP